MWRDTNWLHIGRFRGFRLIGLRFLNPKPYSESPFPLLRKGGAALVLQRSGGCHARKTTKVRFTRLWLGRCRVKVLSSFISVLLLFVLSFFPLSLISFLIIIRRTTPGPSQRVMEAMVSKMPTRTMDNIFRTPLGNTREPFSFKTNWSRIITVGF